MVLSIEKIKDEAMNIASKYSIKKIVLFGSYAEGTATEQSDVDVLIEFNVPAVSLFVLSDVKYELEEKYGKQVDVIHGPLMENAMIRTNKVVSLYE